MFEHILLREKVSRDEIMIGIFVFILTTLIISILKKVMSKYPPGPYGLPVFGYLPYLTKTPYTTFIELGKKYGDIFSMNLGSRPFVVLNSADLIRETFLNPECLGRPPFGAFVMFKKKSPFFSSNVSVWNEQRRFVMQSMRDLGLGKSKIEEHIKDEVNAFLDVIRASSGKPVDLSKPLSSSMSNNISALVFGTRYPYDHPMRMQLDKNTSDIGKFLGQTDYFHYFPWIRYIPFFKLKGYEDTRIAYESMFSIFRKMIKEHKKTLDPLNVRDYVDSYLIQMKTKKEKDPNTTFNEETLVDSANDLFGAGSETVRTFILWLIYIMAAYPNVQKHVQAEILDVIGTERMAEFLDQKSMPYTHAVIMEINRWKTIVPLNLIHYTTADINVGGYVIPRNTSVLANFWAVHHDRRDWEDPDDFKPERFLSSNGKSVIKPPNYMPFSIGKRTCPGENMAYLEIFLYCVLILQKFDIQFPSGVIPTFESDCFLTLKPRPYKVCFISKTK